MSESKETKPVKVLVVPKGYKELLEANKANKDAQEAYGEVYGPALENLRKAVKNVSELSKESK